MPEVSSRRSRSPRAPSVAGAGAAPAAMNKAIPRRPRVPWWLGVILAIGFAAVVAPAITAERWLLGFRVGAVAAGAPAPFTVRAPAPFTVRAPMLAGYPRLGIHGGVVVARGEPASRDQAAYADAIAAQTPSGLGPSLALFGLVVVLAWLYSHHLQRSTKGRLARVQVVSLIALAALAVAVKALTVLTALSALVVPVAVLAMVPTLVLDRTVGLATGVLAALVVSLLGPFDVGLAILLLAQAATAGLVIPERPKRRWTAALITGAVTTACTTAIYVLLTYLTTGGLPDFADPLHAAWLAAAIGPAIAAVICVPIAPVYQRLVGEITLGKLVALEDLGNPMLRQIAERSPGTWQHSLMMANMAEIAANAIGAHGRLVRVGAYYHDLGKSLSPKYFIENLEAGETSPHDHLPPEVSCDAIFAHVTDGVAAARRAGLHERIIDFMHMHHGDGVLEYFWAKCREQGNPHAFTAVDFRYPGHPPQSRETAILAICDAVEAASRTLKKPDAASIDALVQRIVYGKLHLGQLDESGLSMADLRRISDSLRETIRHANHGRIEYPWQKAAQDASASEVVHSGATLPRLDSLDRQPKRDGVPRQAASLTVPPLPADASIPPDDPVASTTDVAYAATADLAGPGGKKPVVPASPVSLVAPPDARGRSSSGSGSAYAAYEHGEAYGARDLETISLGPADRLDRRDRPTERARPVHAEPDAGRPVDSAVIIDPAPAPLPASTTPGVGPVPVLKPPARLGPADDIDAAVTQPSMLAAQTLPGWSNGLAERVDAALESGTWGKETPVAAPTSAELRALLGHPDPTRRQPVVELEQLQRRAVELAEADPARRPPHPTTEVDPDDIEAALEVAPPARRHAGGHAVIRPRKKPE
jgi:putative nucleotidyltransferase with HDIG domain